MSNYIRHIIYLTPPQIKSFGKRLILPQDYSNLKNKERFIVFLTKPLQERCVSLAELKQQD